jgi:voltage-gated potassium channel Kch
VGTPHIICGFGRVGRQVADEFRVPGVELLVLDFDQGRLLSPREAVAG